MSPATLMGGTRVRVERPRALSFTEVQQYLADRRNADLDWEEVGTGDHTSYEPVATHPSPWVAMVEAAAQAGTL